MATSWPGVGHFRWKEKRTPKVSDSEKKRRKAASEKIARLQKVNIGDQRRRWDELKSTVGSMSNANWAKLLLDIFEENQQPKRKSPFTSAPTPQPETSKSTTPAPPSPQPGPSTPAPALMEFDKPQFAESISTVPSSSGELSGVVKLESDEEQVAQKTDMDLSLTVAYPQEEDVDLYDDNDIYLSDEEGAGQMVMVHSTFGWKKSRSNAETPIEHLTGQLAGTSPDNPEPIIIQPKGSDRLSLDIQLPLDEIKVKEEAQTSEVNGELALSKETVNEEEDGEEEEELEEDDEDEEEGEEEKGDDPSWFPGFSWKVKRNQADFAEEVVESNAPLPQEPKQNIEMEIFPCNFCEETFDEYQPMVGHSLSCHGDQEVKKCSFCGYEWKELIEDRVQEVTNHLAEAHGLGKLANPGGNKGDKYVCTQCTFMCTIPSLFVFHVEEQHEKTMFSCLNCPYKVIHRYQIHLHLERQHEWDRSSPVCQHIKVMKRDVSSRNKVYLPCGICGQRFPREDIRKHLQIVHRAEVEGQDFKCQDCSKHFTTYRTFNQHRSDAHEKTKCAICQQYFGNRRIVRKHIEMSHLGVKYFHCSICDFYVYNRTHFFKHMSSVHEGLRLYLCESCGKEFKTSHALEVHTRIHTGEKPLKCEFCEYSCRQRNALNWHMKKHKDKVAVTEQILHQSNSLMGAKQGRRPKQRSSRK